MWSTKRGKSRVKFISMPPSVNIIILNHLLLNTICGYHLCIADGPMSRIHAKMAL